MTAEKALVIVARPDDRVVGVVEILAGVAVALEPRSGAYLVVAGSSASSSTS